MPASDALQEAMADFGGFDHNAQSLRVVTKLERSIRASMASTSPGRRWKGSSSTTARSTAIHGRAVLKALRPVEASNTDCGLHAGPAPRHRLRPSPTTLPTTATTSTTVCVPASSACRTSPASRSQASLCRCVGRRRRVRRQPPHLRGDAAHDHHAHSRRDRGDPSSSALAGAGKPRGHPRCRPCHRCLL